MWPLSEVGVFGEPQPDPLLGAEISVPAHIRDAVTPKNTP
jgi:hypothetical protein